MKTPKLAAAPADNASDQAPPPTRDRLITAMQDALRRKGYHGIGLNELLVQAGAPKGVLYHHFAGGKAELAVVAIELTVEQLNCSLDKLLSRGQGPAQALQSWLTSGQKLLADSGFESGCPLATIGLESTPEDQAIRAAVAAGFGSIRAKLEACLRQVGVEAARARQLAALVVSTYEGALLQARVAGRVDAMRDACAGLMEFVRLSLPARADAA